jgi:uncharacterized membrane protein YphA (DoxX/SURF4 family)
MKKIIKLIEKNQKYSVTIIRLGIALVLLWFGINQMLDSGSFIGYVPPWAMPHPAHMMHFPPIHAAHDAGFDVNLMIRANGLLETIIGLFLLVGLYTRAFAFVATIHLFIISISLGYNDVAIRDFGLTLMALSLVFSGAGVLSFDNKK